MSAASGLEPVPPAGDEGHRRTGVGQRAGHGGAEARRRAGHDGDRAVEGEQVGGRVTRADPDAAVRDREGHVGGPGTSSTTAVDIPPPAHMAATAVPPPRRRSSWVSEMIIRAPVIATG